MEEGKVPPGTSDGGGSSGGGESSRPPSSYVKVGDRPMFTVELRPGETTIVSWKKLMKDASKASGSNSVPDPPVNVRPNLEARIAPGQPDENELKDASHPNRFSAVIEKIERLYMGKDSSDDEDLLDVPDDDQYDTEDSFIDDTELDEYFEVDNSTIKHDGFFVNRGKLERLNEHSQLPSQQPKKRRRKDLVKNNAEGGDDHGSNKHLKVSKPQASKTSLLPAKSSFDSSQNLAILNEDCDEFKSWDQSNTSLVCSKKKSSEAKQTLDLPVSQGVSNGDASVPVVEVKDVNKQQLGFLQSKNIREKCKDTVGSLDVTHQKYHEKSTNVNSKSQHGRPLCIVLGLETSYSSKERNGKNALPDLNLTDGKPTVQAIKPQYTQRKDGNRPKNLMLEKAIRELEKMVAESRPPAGENQEADSSQAVKRRLPREIKLKLAKVARLAQASHGKVSKELINHLMSILGHLIQLRTLKRNLKVMISMGLSAKQETNDRFQKVKKEVVEMIRMQAPSLDSKQLGGTSDDFQELGSDEKGSSRKKFCMDTALEDKICELYDLFVDGLDDDAAPQVRKLYAELAQLWPSNCMDSHGIKRAIIRAKERRGAMHSRHKDHGKMKRKKMLTPRPGDPVRGETSSVAQQQHAREKLTPDSGNLGFPSANKLASNVTNTGVRIPSSSMSASIDRLKPEKTKGSSGSHGEDTRVVDGTLVKKKVKRKPDLDMNRSLLRPEKSPAQGEERVRPPKQSAGLPVKSNLQLQPLSGVEQSS